MNMFRKSAKGFTLVEIMIVVAIIGILIAIAVPGFVKARTQSRAKACQENLTKIDGAKEQYAMEKNLTVGAGVAMTDLVGADLYIKSEPKCPAGAGAAYVVNILGTAPTCPVVAANTDHVLP